MPTENSPLVPGYDKVNNKFIHVGTSKPKSRDIVKSMFHSKEYKLRDLAKKLGMRPSQVMSVMFNRNDSDTNKLDDRIASTGENVWTFTLSEAPTVAPVLPDSTKPVVINADVLNNLITITFEDVNYLDASKVPSLDKFHVSVNGSRMNVSRVQINKNTNVLKLILSESIKFGDVIEITYTKPDSPRNSLQDTAKNLIEDFILEVNNLSPEPDPAPTAPTEPEADGTQDPPAPETEPTPAT